jgi:hypothetical protein
MRGRTGACLREKIMRTTRDDGVRLTYFPRCPRTKVASGGVREKAVHIVGGVCDVPSGRRVWRWKWCSSEHSTVRLTCAPPEYNFGSG